MKIHKLEQQKVLQEHQKTRAELERERVYSLFEIARRHVDEEDSAVRNKDKALEVVEDRHRKEINAYKHKIKHLLHERENSLSSFKRDTSNALKLQHRSANAREALLHAEKRSLKSDLKEEELAHAEIMRQLKMEQAKVIAKMRQEFAMARVDMEHKYETQVKTLYGDFDLRLNHEVHEIEERNNGHVNSLIKAHDVAFTELKNYYNDITRNNLNIIKTLKDELEDVRKREAANDILMHEISEENKRMADPLTRALQEVQELRRALAQQGKDKQALGVAQNRLLDAKNMYLSLEKEYVLQGRRLTRAQLERDEFRRKFELVVHDIQQKTRLKNMLDERKLDVAGEKIKRRDAELGEVLCSFSLNPEALQRVSKKLDEVLASKGQLISSLQRDNLKLSKAYNDLVLVYRAMMNKFGVPVEELGMSNEAAMSDLSSFAEQSAQSL